MRTVIASISLILLFVLTGCATTVPVSSMSDWQLKSEYDKLQLEQIQLEREMLYGERIYNTRTSGGYTIKQPTIGGSASGLASGFARGLGNYSTTVVSNPAITKLNKAENRMREIQSEVLRRQQMQYRTATPPQSCTSSSWSEPVYSTNHSRTFHSSGCSKLKSKEGDLIKFSSSEKARKNGGKPCSRCNP